MLSLLRPLAILVLFLFTPFATAAEEPVRELTAKERRLVDGLPPVEKVLAVLPRRTDPVEAAVQEQYVLSWLSEMAYELVPAARRPKEVHERINMYHRARMGNYDNTVRMIGLTPATDAWAIGDRMDEIWRRMYPTYQDGNQMMLRVIEATMDGDIEDHASDLAKSQIRQATRGAPNGELEQAIADLPQPWRGYAEYARDLPRTFWITFFVVWLLLGIAFRTTPFRLRPDDPWVLQKGRKKRPMEREIMTVLQVKEVVIERRREEYDVNEYGQRQGMAREYVSRSRTMTLFVRRESGHEDTLKLLNVPLDIREGHRILVVSDPRNGNLLFIYNYDLRSYRGMPALKGFLKMRPLVLIPVAALAGFAALQTPYEPYALAVSAVTAVAYLFFMWIVNTTRRWRFRNKMAPRLIELAGSAGPSNYIGNSEFGLSQA